MPTTDFSGRDIVKVRRTHGFEFRGRSGSHVQLRDVTDDGEVRNVTVPMYDRIDNGLLRDIARQCGANDFQAWCDWIDRNRSWITCNRSRVARRHSVSVTVQRLVSERDEVRLLLEFPVAFAGDGFE